MSKYLRLLFRLLPNREACPRDEDSTYGRYFKAIDPELQGLETAGKTLLSVMDPRSEDSFLPEWEEFTGQKGLASVRAQILAQGGQSLPYLTAVARSTGRDVQVIPCYESPQLEPLCQITDTYRSSPDFTLIYVGVPIEVTTATCESPCTAKLQTAKRNEELINVIEKVTPADMRALYYMELPNAQN